MIMIVQIIAMPVFGIALLVGMACLERAVDERIDLDNLAADPDPYPIDPVPAARPTPMAVTPVAPGLVPSASGRPAE